MNYRLAMPADFFFDKSDRVTGLFSRASMRG